MQITVQFAAQVRLAAGASSQTLDLPEGSTPADVLRRLAELHGEKLQSLLLDRELQPHPWLLLFVGDEQVRPTDAGPLTHGSSLTILSPISGG